MRGGLKTWGFLMERIDARIAVSRMAAESAGRWLGPGFEIMVEAIGFDPQLPIVRTAANVITVAALPTSPTQAQAQ